MSQSAPGPNEAAIGPASPDQHLSTSEEEHEANLHSRLVAEVRDLQEEAVMMRRRFMNSWIHHHEYSQKLVTLPEWAEARGVTRHAAYALRRRHSDFPLPMGRFGGGMVFSREALDSWFKNNRVKSGRRGSDAAGERDDRPGRGDAPERRVSRGLSPWPGVSVGGLRWELKYVRAKPRQRSTEMLAPPQPDPAAARSGSVPLAVTITMCS